MGSVLEGCPGLSFQQLKSKYVLSFIFQKSRTLTLLMRFLGKSHLLFQPVKLKIYFPDSAAFGESAYETGPENTVLGSG